MTEYRISRLGHLGEGVAEGPIYAPLTLPGETVSGHLQGDRLTEVKIVEPSGDRVKPPCRHFKSCGGCQLQHAADGFVAQWKKSVVETALKAKGIDTIPAEITTSPSHSRRRASFSARRGKKGAMVGFHARGSDVIVENPDCILLLPQVLGARETVAELAVVGGSRKGAISALVTQSDAGLDIRVSGGKPLDGPLRIALADLAHRHQLARLAWEDEVVVTGEAPAQSFGKARVVPPAGAFLQATKQGELALLDSVSEAVQGARKIVDLFAGCGTFTLPLAAQADMHAYEGDRAMIAALDQGWRKSQGLKHVTATARDLFRNPLLPEDLGGFDAIVIDPPRAGAKAQVAQIAQSDVPVIAFVSCNPVTFARDARDLIDGGYGLDWVRVVDQFRWSSHIEIAAKFRRI